jgi:biopolymer transport protein ExbB
VTDHRSLHRMLVAAFIALSALLAPLKASAAAAWWNSDWQYRKAITVRLPTTTPGSASSMVLPVRLHAGNFGYFQDVQPSGADLRFISDDGTPLHYQIELLDPTAGLLVAWIETPVKAGATEQSIWMYYGNPRATAPESTALYDADQALVLHFADSQNPLRDATANRYDPAASSAQFGMPGVLGNGARFDGKSVVHIAARPGLALTETGGLAFAAWVRLDAESPSSAVLYSQAQADRRVEIGITGLKLYAQITDGRRVSRIESTKALSTGAWQHVAVSVGTEIALYLDGAPAGTVASGGLPAVGGDVQIGGLDSGEGGLIGQLDEVEISKAPRSAWWAQVTALGQSPDTTLIAYGTDESKGSAGKLAAYFAMMGNLLKQVSLDGLAVITITAFLGLASLQVLFSRAALLNRVERQDARFLAEFPERLRREVQATQTPADAAPDDAFDVSGLHDMYRAGLGGLAAAATASGSTHTVLRLSSEAFEAIRAALDGAMVEATNRLNSRLVIMTIAIAGAPFMGLLGTVVGVMITFASIAAAGDVNVNTIAPGVAAAMSATVVGLLVAIPSLFGYNWLATRISRRTTAMEVFADQFLSSLALLSLAARQQPMSPVNSADERPLHAA